MEETEKRNCVHQVRIQERANLKPPHESRKQSGRKPSAVQDEIHHCFVQRLQVFFGKAMNGLGVIKQAETVGIKENDSDSNAMSTSWNFLKPLSKLIQLFGTPGEKSFWCVCRLKGSTRIKLN